MIKDEIVIKRYGDAFIGFAKENSGLEKGLKDFKNLKRIIHNNPEFLEFLQSLEITYSEKCEFIDKVLTADFSEEIRQFLRLLLRKDRIDKLADICEYIRVAYSYGQKTEAVLKTSFPLDVELIESIKAKLERRFKKQLKLYINLDGSLLGGVQVIIGNTIIDGSIRGRLNDIKEKLSTIRV